MQITTPPPVSNLYSEADMRFQLATMPGVETPCAGAECEWNQKFDQRVQQLGARLGQAAFAAYPDLIKRVKHFEFVVEEKSDSGTASNARGRVVIFRGTQRFAPDDMELAFLMAREMGHVIGRHHDENSATRLLLTVAVGVLFPALHLFNGTTALAQATSATTTTLTSTVATAAASTTTSYLGSRMVLASIKPSQLGESDVIAMKLLETLGWSQHDVATGLEIRAQADGDNAWEKDFRLSVNRLKMLDEDAQAAAYNLAVESIALQAAQDELQRGGVAEAGWAVSAQAAENGEPVAGTEAIEVMKPEGAEMPAATDAAAQPVLVNESAVASAGGWSPAKGQALKMARSLAWTSKTPQVSVSKSRQPAKTRISFSGKRKPAAKSMLGKKDRLKSKQGGDRQALTLRPTVSPTSKLRPTPLVATR